MRTGRKKPDYCSPRRKFLIRAEDVYSPLNKDYKTRYANRIAFTVEH